MLGRLGPLVFFSEDSGVSLGEMAISDLQDSTAFVLSDTQMLNICWVNWACGERDREQRQRVETENRDGEQRQRTETESRERERRESFLVFDNQAALCSNMIVNHVVASWVETHD